MIKKSRVEARIDSELKNKVTKILNQLDISESEAIRIYYRQININKGIPFELKIPNQETLAAMNEIKESKLREYHHFDEYLNTLGLK